MCLLKLIVGRINYFTEIHQNYSAEIHINSSEEKINYHLEEVSESLICVYLGAIYGVQQNLGFTDHNLCPGLSEFPKTSLGRYILFNFSHIKNRNFPNVCSKDC